MGVDRFILVLPDRYLKPPLSCEVLGRASEAGAIGRTRFSGMHHAIAAAARSGLNIVADHVFVEEQWAKERARLSANLPSYLVGVNRPLGKAETRERGR